MDAPNDRDCWHLIDHSHVKDFEVDRWVKIILALIYSFIFVAGILGNSVTIQTSKILQKKGYMQKAVTDHMISLACSDLLVILLGMPVEFYSIIWNPFSTRKGDLTCKLYSFLFEACSYATVLHVATLSFERYIAICHPFKFKATSGTYKVKILIAFVWITSVLVALPLLFAMGAEHPLVDIPNHQGLILCEKSKAQRLPEFSLNVTICTNLSSKWRVFQFSIFTAFIVYIIVLVSVTFMCRNMIKVLMVYKQATVEVKGRGNQSQFLRKAESPESRGSKKQTLIFLGLIVATLAICWLPNQVRRIMMAARPKQDWTVSYFRAYIILLPIADIFFYLSSVVNPLLYNISSQHFRKVFLQVLRCRLSIEHANKKKYLATSLNSAANINRSKRPLIFTSSRRKSSTKAAQKVSSNILQDEAEADSSLPKQSPESLELNVRTQKVSSNILQDEAEIDSSLPKQSPESLELNVRTMPLETSIDPSLVNQNGICEHE